MLTKVLLIFALCGELFAQTLTIAYVSDIHGSGPCAVASNGVTAGFECMDAEHTATWNMIRSWNPDYIVMTGDLGNGNSSRADAYKGILVNSLTSVASGSHQVVIDTTTLNGNLNIWGTSNYTGGVQLLPVTNSLLAVDEDNPASFEIVPVTAVADTTHVTCRFAKSHTAPFKMRNSATLMFADYMAAGKFIMSLGNHDHGAGTTSPSLDWCTAAANAVVQCPQDNSYQEYAEMFPSTSIGFGANPYFIRSLGGLVTLLAADWGATGSGGVGTPEELYFHSTLSNCPTQWCVGMTHNPTVTSYTPGHNTTVHQWLAGDAVDIVWAGHHHWYERATALNFSGSKTINYVTNGTATEAFENCVGIGGCSMTAGGTQQAFFSDVMGAAKVVITTTTFVEQEYDYTGTLRDSFTLTKVLTTLVLAPTITKTFGAATIPPNGSTSLSFTITNPNAAASLSGVGFTDTLPSGLIVATPNGLTGSCGSGTITATAGSGTVSLTGATLPAGASCTFSVNVLAVTEGVKNNTTGPVTSTEGGNGTAASAILRVASPPTLTKTFADSQVDLFFGSTALSFTLTNPNTVTTLTGLAFTDTLPSGLIVSTPNGLTGSCGGGTITAIAGSNSISLSGATLAPGASCIFSVNVTGIAIGVQTNTTSSITALGGTLIGLPATATTSVDDLWFNWFFAESGGGH